MADPITISRYAAAEAQQALLNALQRAVHDFDDEAAEALSHALATICKALNKP